MANPLKVLTQLSASKEAQFADVVEMQKTVTLSGAEADLIVSGGGEISGSGELKIAGASQLGSTLAVQGDANLASKLDVKGASALSGTLGVVGAADLQSTLAVAGAADLNGALDVQGAANFQDNVGVSGSLKSVGEISGSAALNIGGAAHIVGAAQLDSTLNVSGNVQLDANLNVDGAADFDSTLDVAGNVTFQASASIQGDLTVQGDLFVEGTRTFLNTNELRVEDKNILIASSSMPVDSSTADGAGITVMGSTTNKEFKWLDATQAWTSSEHMDLAAGKVYKIAGEEVLAKNASAAKLSLNGGSAQIAVSSSTVAIAGDLSLADDLDVAGYIHAGGEISGSGELKIAGAADLNGALDVAGIATFQAAVSASANVDVAGFLNVNAANGIKLGGVDTIKKDAGNLYVYGPNERTIEMTSVSTTVYGGLLSNDAFAANGVSNFNAAITASAGVDIAGALHVVDSVDFDSTLNVDGEADFQAAADFHADVAMDAALNLSGSAFINIATPVVAGKYNVNDAIRALDAKAGQQASDINNAYANLRYLASASFDGNGMAAFTSSFAAASIHQVTVDVLVQAGGSGPWTNDLVSVQVKEAGSYVGFEISAPAMGASDKVRIIAVKESGSLA